MVKKITLGPRVDKEKWQRFVDFVVKRYGSKHGFLGRELGEALDFYVAYGGVAPHKPVGRPKKNGSWPTPSEKKQFNNPNSKPKMNKKTRKLVEDFVEKFMGEYNTSLGDLETLIKKSLDIKTSEQVTGYIERLEEMGYISHETGELWNIERWAI